MGIVGVLTCGLVLVLLVLLLRWWWWYDSAARHRNQTLTGGGVKLRLLLGRGAVWGAGAKISSATAQHSHNTPQHYSIKHHNTTTLHH